MLIYEGPSSYPAAREKTMFRIGDFSKLSRVSIKTLRYYDEIGLLKSNDIDRYTRYRYYAMDQLNELKQILVLKELGFSLEQIASLLVDDLSPEQLKGMLLLRKAEIEQQIQSAEGQLGQITGRLKRIEQESKNLLYEVKEWFPKSGYQPGDGPDFEYYPEHFNPDADPYLLYIYFPVVKA
jgi:DNA-binding transcriptional MerR regulator